jgi:hypothetical protein
MNLWAGADIQRLGHEDDLDAAIDDPALLGVMTGL